MWMKGFARLNSHKWGLPSNQMVAYSELTMKTQLEWYLRSKWGKTELELKMTCRNYTTASKCCRLKRNEHSNILKTPEVGSKTCWQLRRLLLLKKSRNARLPQPPKKPNWSQPRTTSTVPPSQSTKLSQGPSTETGSCSLRRQLTRCSTNLQCLSS